jgi:hypothetical protein
LLSPQRERQGENYPYCDSWRTITKKRANKKRIKNENDAKKIKSNNSTKSNKKSLIQISQYWKK